MQKPSNKEQLLWRKHYMSTVMDSGEVYAWHVPKLWELARTLPTINVLVVDIYKTVQRHIEEEYIEEDWVRVRNADLSYPILINDVHGVVDGVHRIAKAYKTNKRYIKAKRIETMPKPDIVFANVTAYENYFNNLK